VKAVPILEAVLNVTKGWAKQRKAEERNQSARSRRLARLISSREETIKDVAWEVMEAAYMKASANDTLPAHARQIMYAARGKIQERTGKTLDDAYFTQTLLPDYIDAHPEAADWNVVFDARGHFAEPHTNLVVPLGTLDVRQYLDNVESHTVKDLDLALSDSHGSYPTYGPEHRFSAVLFIEKEGFMPLFKQVRLAERFDLAIMSTKGLSVVASRRLVDILCGGKGSVPLLVLHDFDKAGFSILQTLHQDTRRYEFKNAVNVIDLGLRLADVQAEGLQSESVFYGTSDPRLNLRDNGATEEEIQFLCSSGSRFSGQRVELNAFASDQFIAWLESKLAEHGVKKVVPDETTLRAAYQRALTVATFRKRAEAMADEIHEEVMATVVPKNLRKLVRKRLTADDKIPWDQAMADLVQETVDDEAAGGAK
jgi:hypothetical protein